jgi:3-oxoacyl-[acyl-carrier protein] reductase
VTPTMKGKVVLVTGAARGIGAAMALAFGAAGARVAVNYRVSRRDALEVARQCGGEAVGGDVRKGDKLVAEVVRRFGRLDVLVNNAGAADPAGWTRDLDAITDPLWYRIVETDLRGTFLCSRAAARVMKRNGKIINVASIPALLGESEALVYATAKAGIVGLTKSLAVQLAPRIQVNCMALGSIETGWANWLTPAMRRSYESAIPLGRFGQPEEVAELALFLAGNDWVTGQTYVLDGGEARI